ncbi:MAG: hypothetical protein MUC74_12805, partial [Ideonella sp.]|nr:hypothetical protein [Ideonella sp.]
MKTFNALADALVARVTENGWKKVGLKVTGMRIVISSGTWPEALGTALSDDTICRNDSPRAVTWTAAVDRDENPVVDALRPPSTLNVATTVPDCPARLALVMLIVSLKPTVVLTTPPA